MKKTIRSALAYFLTVGWAVSFAGGLPVPDGNGGVSCDPACTTYSCAPTFCMACNSYGCVNIPKVKEPGMG